MRGWNEGFVARVHRWVHPALLGAVVLAMLAVPAAYTGEAFVAVALMIIVLLGLLEAFLPFEARSQTHQSDLAGIVGFGVAAYAAGKLAEPAAKLVVSWLPFGARLRDLPLLAEIAVGIVVVELCFYAWHRAGHEVPMLWRLHRVHHLPTKVNLGTYFVFHPIDAFAFAAVRWVPLLALGVSERAFFLITTVGFAHKLLCHSNVGGPLRWLSYLVGTAENHRIHHARDPYEAGNYGFVLPLWDHVFGTFVNLRGRAPQAYGAFAGDTGPAWIRRLLGATPPSSIRLRQVNSRMSELSVEERWALVRLREQRLHPQGAEDREDERKRVLESLDAYTHVIRGFDADGVLRHFSTFYFEYSPDGRHLDALLGPSFKERGYHVRAPSFLVLRHIGLGLLRCPSMRTTVGSTVSLSGYAFLAKRMRGVGWVAMPGDPDLDPDDAAMLERLRGMTGDKVTWDEKRDLVRYPVGVDLPPEEARKLNLTAAERRRYLDRCPEAVGRDSGVVVPVAFSTDARQFVLFILRAAQRRLERLRHRPPACGERHHDSARVLSSTRGLARHSARTMRGPSR